MSRHPPWSILGGATLTRVQLFTCRYSDLKYVAAVKHEFQAEKNRADFWVAVGNGPMNSAGDGDDLYVGLEAPSNVSELPLLETMEWRS